MPWYVLHVASNTEQQVTERLDQASIESFYPYITARSKDKRRDVRKKFFPGYVFANFNLCDRTPVIQIPQVIRILGCDHSPVAIPEPEIEAIRIMANSAIASVTACPYVASGVPVVIKSGPLQGLEGIVVSSKPGKARIVVSITMLQRSMSAEVDYADIELIHALPMAA